MRCAMESCRSFDHPWVLVPDTRNTLWPFRIAGSKNKTTVQNSRVRKSYLDSPHIRAAPSSFGDVIMNRTTGVLAGVLFVIVPAAFAQQSTPQTPEDAYTSRELIAWSQLQKPQPAPQPLPPRDTPVPQPEQPPDQQAKSPGDPQTEQSPAQSFTGRIVKEGAQYVLRAASNTTYELDGQNDLQRYENKNVRVTGTLESGTNNIHVVKIELLS